jgi:hypothetical protein
MRAGGMAMEITRLRITAAGQQALAECASWIGGTELAGSRSRPQRVFYLPVLRMQSWLSLGQARNNAMWSILTPFLDGAQGRTQWPWWYFHGFKGICLAFMVFQLLTQDSTSFDLGAVSPAAQWEFIVSYYRSHPHEQIVRGIQELQLKLLKKWTLDLREGRPSA